jgi:hypothetical protein
MKRMTLLLAITITAVALTQTSTAQMMGGGSSGGGTGSGGHGGTGMGSGGSTGGAGGTGMGSGGGMVGSGGIGMGSGMGTGPGGGMDGAGRLLVTPGGTAFVVTRDSATSGGSIMSAKLVAIGSNGQKAWTWDASGPIQDVATVGDLLIVDVADPSAVGSMQAGAGQATLVALHAATGTETWRLPLGGVSVRLEAATDHILTIVAKMPTSVGGTISRSLDAVDLNGHVLWSVALD